MNDWRFSIAKAHNKFHFKPMFHFFTLSKSQKLLHFWLFPGVWNISLKWAKAFKREKLSSIRTKHKSCVHVHLISPVDLLGNPWNNTKAAKTAVPVYWYSLTGCYCGVKLENYMDHHFQWPLEGMKCEHLAYEVVTKPTTS